MSEKPAPKKELADKALAKAILAREIRPKVAEIRQLAEAVLRKEDTPTKPRKPKKAKKALSDNAAKKGKKAKKKKRLAKIPQKRAE